MRGVGDGCQLPLPVTSSRCAHLPGASSRNGTENWRLVTGKWLLIHAFARTASTYAETRPGKSFKGPYSVRTFRKRGPLIARSQPSPLCERKRVSCHFSNPGRHRLITSRTELNNSERSAASVTCGQITLTGIEVETQRTVTLTLAADAARSKVSSIAHRYRNQVTMSP